MKILVLALGLICVSSEPIYGIDDSDFERSYQRNAYADSKESAYEKAVTKIHDEANRFRHTCEEYLEGTYDINFERDGCVTATGGFVCSIRAVATCEL